MTGKAESQSALLRVHLHHHSIANIMVDYERAVTMYD